jgi:peptide chain release factor 1
MSFESKLDKILDRQAAIQERLVTSQNIGRNEYVELTKSLSELEDISVQIKEYKQLTAEQKDLRNMIQDSADDKEILSMAEEELRELDTVIEKREKDLKVALLPKDEADSKNAIIEVRAGTGGDEAGLFAAQLFSMYMKYADNNNWKFEILSLSETGIGGYREATGLITGKNVFSKLKFESGVHRVQRVPETESSGRVHTSAATVAILPEAEDVDVNIEEKDLRIDVYRASGAGGQHVNCTESAVRIVHIPTGITVQQQDEKSQHKNKAKAMKILKSRLYDHERSMKEAERSAERKDQIKSGDRSDRIRTYNFPQGRVTDHRINLTLYKIDEIVQEGRLEEVIDALISNYETERLSDLNDL